MALWGSGVRIPSAPPSFARNRRTRFRAKDGVLRSFSEGGLNLHPGSVLRMAGHLSQEFMPMFYAYILESISTPGEFDRGHTDDLKRRLAEHNRGHCPHTAKR